MNKYEIMARFDDWCADTLHSPIRFDILELLNSAWNAGFQCASDHIADAGKMIPDGWQLVPKEPTEEMLNAAYRSITLSHEFLSDYEEDYKVMLERAPIYSG